MSVTWTLEGPCSRFLEKWATSLEGKKPVKPWGRALSEIMEPGYVAFSISFWSYILGELLACTPADFLVCTPEVKPRLCTVVFPCFS